MLEDIFLREYFFIYMPAYSLIFKIRVLHKECDVSETINRINLWFQLENLFMWHSLFRLLLLSLIAPIFVMPPSVSPLSPHSLNVSWELPPDSVTRGKVVGYNISMISEQSPQQSYPMVVPQVLLFPIHVLLELNYVFVFIVSAFAEFWQNFHLYNP